MLENNQSLKEFLDSKVKLYNSPDFIENDPISIPHQFSKKQDIEIAGFFAAILAWGQRKTTINKCNELMASMDHAPFDFITSHQESDLKRFLEFKHRTFNATDTLYFIHFFREFYRTHKSLEEAFLVSNPGAVPFLEAGLIQFHNLFFNLPEAPSRTKKHVSTPIRKSTCKRLNMFLRWMVRTDNCGVDFGIWNNISPSQLICPCDVHVDRVARRCGLITRKQTDWLTAIELTAQLSQFDPEDPIKYDYALFGIGVMEKAQSNL